MHNFFLLSYRQKCFVLENSKTVTFYGWKAVKSEPIVSARIAKNLPTFAIRPQLSWLWEYYYPVTYWIKNEMSVFEMYLNLVLRIQKESPNCMSTKNKINLATNFGPKLCIYLGWKVEDLDWELESGKKKKKIKK